MRVPLRVCTGVLVAAALAVGTSVQGPVWGAEPQRQLGDPRRPPRDPISRPQAMSTAPRLRLTAERAAQFVDAAVRDLDYLPGEVLVRFKPLVTPAGQQRALNALRGRPSLADLEWHGPLALARDRTQPNAHVLAQQLMSQAEVAYAEPNYIMRPEPGLRERMVRPDGNLGAGPRIDAAPNDEDYANYQWNLQQLNMPGAWDIQPGGTSEIIVAVIDTGSTTVNTTMTFPLWTGSAFENVAMPFAVNPDLGASRLVDAQDYVFLDPLGPVLDMDGHGSHVASTIGEDTNNALLLSGLAYRVRIMPLKACVGYWEIMIARAQDGTTGFIPDNSGGCDSAGIAAGIRYAADRGAKVLNLSLSGPAPIAGVREALTYAVSKGAFAAVAMGNEYLTGNPVRYPARDAQDIMGVMSVAATGKTQQRARYSNTGAHCEIAAPGGDSSVAGAPDFGVIWQSTLYFPDQDPLIRRPRFDRYDGIGYSGTSMATPHVAGLAALIAAQSPGISPANIELIIRATAKDLGTPGKDNEFGFGLIQPRTVLYGWGIRR